LKCNILHRAEAFCANWVSFSALFFVVLQQKFPIENGLSRIHEAKKNHAKSLDLAGLQLIEIPVELLECTLLEELNLSSSVISIENI
jgi:Leucine-rich repeat (LRR) protein